MNKDELIAVLNDWNFWRQDMETGFLRQSYVQRVRQLLETKQVITITGPRRAGKSYVMRQVAKTLTEQGVAKERLMMVNFEDPRFTELTPRLLDQIYETYQQFLSPRERPYLLLDEVQEVAGWEKWVRTMHELQKAGLVISGSNAKLLSQELGTLLTGRHLDVTVLPLSFREFLDFQGVSVSTPLEVAAQRAALQGHLRRYMEFGAFPEVVRAGQPKAMLLQYVEDLVTKDVLRRFRVRKPQALHALVKHYLSNTATLTTFHAAAQALQLSPLTVEKFAGYLAQVYLVFFVKRFSFKVKEQEKSPRKVYAIDTGLSNMVGFRFSENLGRLAENLVFLELKRRQALHPAREYYYWKDAQHHEVDFVVKDGLRVTSLIQVCWTLDAKPTKDRELRSLAKAMEALKVSQALVITEEQEAEETHHGRRITFVPLWRWLLET